jgi:hypothetical protein
MKTLCPVCGISFKAERKSRIYCSRKCSSRSQSKPSFTKCEICERVFKFKRPIGRVARFCSNTCRGKWMTNSGKWSGENNVSWRGGKPKCHDCGKLLASCHAKRCKPCAANTPERRQQLKSAHHLSGEKHPLWKGGLAFRKKDDRRGDSAYRSWRLEVWKRDGFTCQQRDANCRGKIEAHHILAWSTHPELRYKLTNGITLCQAHHPRKRAEEKRLAPVFRGIVTASKKQF